MRTIMVSSHMASCVAAAMFAAAQAFHIPETSMGRESRTYIHAAAPTTTHRHNAAPLYLSTIASPNDKEATRFRNRSILLENTLRQKVQALKLSDQKLSVLQDAVKRVMAARTTDQQLEEQANHHHHNEPSTTAFVAVDTAAELQVLEWKARYERAETARLEAVSAMSQIQRQYDERKIQIQNERDRLIYEMETLQKTYRNDQKRWEADVEIHMKAQKDLVELDRDLKRSLRQLEETRTEMKEAKQELANYRASVQQISTTATSETEIALQRERERVKTLRTQWAELKMENTRLEENHLAHAEAIQIAQASVAAAERREETLQSEVASLKGKYDELLKIHQELQLKVQEFTLQQQTSAAEVVDTTQVEDFVLIDPVFEKSPFVVEQEMLHPVDHSEVPKSSRLKRIASVIFGPVRRWRVKRSRLR